MWHLNSGFFIILKSCEYLKSHASLVWYLVKCTHVTAAESTSSVWLARALYYEYERCTFQGQMIPPPLHHTAELLPHLSPYEVYLLLLNLWRYVKVRELGGATEHPPTHT